MLETKRTRYENYLNRAQANGWDDQAEHWQNLLDALDSDNEVSDN